MLLRYPTYLIYRIYPIYLIILACLLVQVHQRLFKAGEVYCAHPLCCLPHIEPARLWLTSSKDGGKFKVPTHGRVDGVREEVMDIGHIHPQHLGGQVTGKSCLPYLLTCLLPYFLTCLLAYLLMQQGQEMLYLCVVHITMAVGKIC